MIYTCINHQLPGLVHIFESIVHTYTGIKDKLIAHFYHSITLKIYRIFTKI